MILDGHTSRRSNPRSRSTPTPQGIGMAWVTFRALRVWRTSVRRISMPACNAIPSKIFPRLTSVIFHHRPLIPPCSSLNGNASSPCSLILTAKDGTALSKSRKPIDGRMQNKLRIASVPISSTLRGECERMRVVHVK